MPKFKILILFFTFLFLKQIYPQQIILLKPQSGDKINSIDRAIIEWEGPTFEEVKIEYTLDEQSWIEANFLGWGESTSQYCYWDAPDTIARAKIRITELSDSTNYYENDNYFQLYKVSYNTIDVNNCTIMLANNGMSSHHYLSGDSGFFWNESNKTKLPSIFSDGLIWGCKVNNQIKVNGNTYRNGLIPGMILQNGHPAELSDTLIRIYKIHKSWFILPPGPLRDQYEYDYTFWPTNQGAPFIDNNGDGIFTAGIDKPEILGDMLLYYVANDLDSNTTKWTYGSLPIGLEFQTTVWAHFTDNFLNDVVFKKYKIINKSEYTIDDMYLSYWTDDDMGFAGDDFVGCDTTLSLGYTYNGDNDDEDYYGVNPPAVGHMLLQGPKLNEHSSKTSKFLSSFIDIDKHSLLPNDPVLGDYEKGTLEFYNLMQGLDNLGNPIIDPNNGDTTKFMVAGDPVEKIGWFAGDGWPDGPTPKDKRYVMTSGPFTMAPGDTQEVVYAIFMARGSNNIQSVEELKKTAVLLHEFWGNNIAVDVKTESETIPNKFSLSQNYPNPFNPSTTIEYSIPFNVETHGHASQQLIVYDVLGREVATLVNQPQKPGNYKVNFNANQLSSGIYFYQLKSGNFIETKKMILIK